MRTVSIRDESTEAEVSLRRSHRVACDRRSAGSIECCEEGALARNCDVRLIMVERIEELETRFVTLATRDANRSLRTHIQTHTNGGTRTHMSRVIDRYEREREREREI